MDNKIYWFITCFNFNEKGHVTASRCFGFFTNKAEAIRVIENNETDLWEYLYDYAVIEPYYEGLYGYVHDNYRQFYKYNQKRNMYEPIDTPECFIHVYGFAI